MVIVSSIL